MKYQEHNMYTVDYLTVIYACWLYSMGNVWVWMLCKMQKTLRD